MFDFLSTTDHQDSDIKQWLFVFTVIGAYLYFVLKCGPAYMRERKPYNLRSLMLWYNAVQVIFNGWLSVYSFYAIVLQTGSLVRCIASDELTGRLHYYYVCNKYFDLLDTVIFVLRKKNNQISFLHVFHHCAVLIFPLWTYTVWPGGEATMVGALNSGVHTAMYSYYFLMIYSEASRRRFVDYKQTLTQGQLVQFTVLVCQFGRAALGFCEYPLKHSLMVVTLNVLFLYMFSKFYIKTYLRKKPSVE